MAKVMQESSVISQNKKPHLEHLKANGGFFQRFEWMPDEYNPIKPFNLDEINSNKMKQASLHGDNNPFNPS